MFLRTNTDKIKQAITEVFAGSEEVEFKGKLIACDYAEVDCSDFTDLGSKKDPLKKKFGPGIRIAVEFNDHKVRRFFYPEDECKSIEDFIDNLNTDFGMTQIMNGRATKSLEICHYDLTENKIYFYIGRRDQPVEKNLLDECWDVKELTFNVTKFSAIKTVAEQEAGMSFRGGAVPKGLFDASTQPKPTVIKVLGIKLKSLEPTPAVVFAP
jgi:hypothetical protein